MYHRDLDALSRLRLWTRLIFDILHMFRKILTANGNLMVQLI